MEWWKYGLIGVAGLGGVYLISRGGGETIIEQPPAVLMGPPGIPSSSAALATLAPATANTGGGVDWSAMANIVAVQSAAQIKIAEESAKAAREAPEITLARINADKETARYNQEQATLRQQRSLIFGERMQKSRLVAAREQTVLNILKTAIDRSPIDKAAKSARVVFKRDGYGNIIGVEVV